MENWKTRFLLLVEGISILVLGVAVDVFLFRDWLARLYPSGDEFSLIMQSQSAPWHWFKEGYARYFVVYPEYTVPYSNFVRPAANAIYRIFFHLVSGDRLQLIFVNYGVHAAIAGLFYIAGVLLLASRKLGLLLATVAFLAPAFWASPMTLYPSFALDGLAALLVLCGVLMLAKSYDWLGVSFLLLAVFTKEASLPVVCALAVYFLLARRGWLAGILSSILLLWAAIRWVAFGRSSGVYELSSSGHAAKFFIVKLAGLAFLPIPFMTRTAIKATITSRSFWGVGVVALFLAGNIIAWILTLAIVRSKGLLPPQRQLHSMAALCTGFSLIFLVLAGGGDGRLSYVFYVCLLMMVMSADWTAHRRSICGLMLILIASSAFADITAVRTLDSQKDLDIAVYDGSRALVADLKNIRSTTHPIYVIDDFVSGYSAEQNVATYAGHTGELDRASSIDMSGCRTQEFEGVHFEVKHISEEETDVTTSIPACATFAFEGASPDLLVSKASGTELGRNDHLSYSVPGLHLNRTISGTMQPEMGSSMTVMVRGGSILLYDFADRRWIYIP